MPPHTTLQFSMPPNTTTTSNTSTMNSNLKQTNTSSSTSTQPVTRQRRATTSASYVFAPSWLTKDKAGPTSTVLNPAYTSTLEQKIKEEGKLGVTNSSSSRQTKEQSGKDASPLNGFSRPYTNGALSNRSKTRDLFSSYSASGPSDKEESESTMKSKHGRSRSYSQAQSLNSFSPTSFEKNFPTLAKKKVPLSVDISSRNEENIWAKTDAKSKVLSPTVSMPLIDDSYQRHIDPSEIDIERFKSLVPKVEDTKLDGKRSTKRKTSRSLSMDSGGESAAAINISNIGSAHTRTTTLSQHFRPYLRESASMKPINIQPTRPRSTSISTSIDGKKTSATTLRVGGQPIMRRMSAGSNTHSKYPIWNHHNQMGRMGFFRMGVEEDMVMDRKENINTLMGYDHIEEEEDELSSSSSEEEVHSNREIKDFPINKEIKDNLITNTQDDHLNQLSPDTLKCEENFLLQLGWKKTYEEDNDSSKWAITEEEKRAFVNLVRTLNGNMDNLGSEGDNEEALTVMEIDRAKRKWAAKIMARKRRNGTSNDIGNRAINNLLSDHNGESESETETEVEDGDANSSVFIVM